MTEIIRPQTTAEKRDFQDLNSVDYRQKFEDDLARFEQECLKKYIPFCSRCARLEYKDRIADIAKEQERTQGFINYADPRFKSIVIDFNQYTKSDRFELLETSEIIENTVIDGTKIQSQTGYYENFKCKVRNCGIAIQIPKKVYEARKKV
jgi:hypothetical protein